MSISDIIRVVYIVIIIISLLFTIFYDRKNVIKTINITPATENKTIDINLTDFKGDNKNEEKHIIILFRSDINNK